MIQKDLISKGITWNLCTFFKMTIRVANKNKSERENLGHETETEKLSNTQFIFTPTLTLC
jgi:hypothetical protein